MMMRSLVPNASVFTTFTRNSLYTQRINYIDFGQRHYQSVCGAAKYFCSYNKNQYSNLDRRLLAPKPFVLCRTSSVEFHILQKYISNLKTEESRCFNPRYSYHQSEYYYSTANEKEQTRSSEQSTPEEAQKKLSVFQQFKAMLKDYWHVLIPVHVVTSIGWFGGFYYLATSGIDIPALMESMNFSEGFVKPFRDSSMGYIAVCYGLYKVATPARYTVTVGGTSIAIRMLKKRGLVHPWPINIKWLKSDKKKES